MEKILKILTIWNLNPILISKRFCDRSHPNQKSEALLSLNFCWNDLKVIKNPIYRDHDVIDILLHMMGKSEKRMSKFKLVYGHYHSRTDSRIWRERERLLAMM